jgi:hypothetical protein
VEPSAFDEVQFFRSLHQSGVRALLIGRRALVFLGLPVLTADYDFWIAIDDIEAFNAAAAPFDLRPSRTADEARRGGRYVLENDEHLDVLVARSLTTVEGLPVEFDAVWRRKQVVRLDDVSVTLPTLDDLILTKQVAPRAKDLEDIRLLRILKGGQS